MPFLSEEIVSISQTFQSAEEAIQAAGKLLVRAGYVEESYVTAMIESYRENGAYFVITPKVAIPHARFENGVKQAAVSLVVLREPVVFKHPTNDPVSLVFGLAATSSEEHLEVIKKIVQLLSDPQNIEALIQAKSYQKISRILEGKP